MALEWSHEGLRNLDRQMQRSVNLILEIGKMKPKPVQNANKFNYVVLTAALTWTAVIEDEHCTEDETTARQESRARKIDGPYRFLP